ncbi:hypothetical protein K4G22_12425 [Streptomyces profundus]|nr:hypothetical protein [Streptomyces sp. MA3_2.13]UED88428.1 hypothetical protein K4G22_12425 [Streptomyces sp. MA3_2.13]
MPEASPGVTGDPHQVELYERGPFLASRCSCGWYGPARRSRPLARDEAAGHSRTANPGER